MRPDPTPPLPASTSRRDQSVSADTVLVPKLTKFDKRVLSKLDTWDLDRQEPTTWLNAWQVAEALREDDVAMVRRVLRGLDELGYAISSSYGPKQQWAARKPKEETDV